MRNDAAKLDLTQLDGWLAAAKAGKLSWHELAERILQLAEGEIGEHHPDHDRGRRCGFGEVIFGMGKDADAIIAIVASLLDNSQSEVLVTRVDPATAQAVMASFMHTRYDGPGRTLRISTQPVSRVRRLPSPAPPNGRVAVVTAGSTDLPVACEALETLRWMGVDADLISDVGVAGPYRLLPRLSELRACNALVVVAGMEGALASVVGGLVPCPIVAVPTSVGYGANLDGITTLLSMLSSCAAGVTVVNVDAGFKGGYVAGLIAHQTVVHDPVLTPDTLEKHSPS